MTRVRSSWRQAHLSLTKEQSSRLACVNESPVPRIPADTAVSRSIGTGLRTGFAYDREARRFSFNSTDTLPYWYAPMLKSFAAVDGERFLEEAERWIVDTWGYSGDLHDFQEEPRRARFDRDNWRLTDHGPTARNQRWSYSTPTWSGTPCGVPPGSC